MKNISICTLLVALVYLGHTGAYSQERFFYSRGDTILITPSSTKVVVTNVRDFSEADLNTWLSTSGLAQRFELDVVPYGVRRTIITKKKEAMGGLIIL